MSQPNAKENELVGTKTEAGVGKFDRTKEKVSGNLSNAAETVHQNSDSAQEFLSEKVDNAEAFLRKKTYEAGDYTQQKVERANQLGHRAGEFLENSSEYIKNFDINEAKDSVKHTLTRRPEIGIAIAGTFGLLLGLIIGGSRRR
jgi:ElaB/YqjD/DUF883 family membrane-anchored ribosome-binding protein